MKKGEKITIGVLTGMIFIIIANYIGNTIANIILGNINLSFMWAVLLIVVGIIAVFVEIQHLKEA